MHATGLALLIAYHPAETKPVQAIATWTSEHNKYVVMAV
jgi:hypothetical protein